MAEIDRRDLPEVNGWKPPIMYDVARDEWRIVTQADIDDMQSAIRMLAGFKRSVTEGLHTFEQEHNSFLAAKGMRPLYPAA